MFLHEAFSIHRRLGRTLFECFVLQVRLVHMITSVPVPQIQEQNVDVIKVIPQEQMSKRIPEKFVGVPVPQIMEETVEVAKLIAQERIQQRTLEETVNVPVLQIQQQIVAVGKAPF